MNTSYFNTLLLFTILGEFFIPWILKHFYSEYNSKKMVMSALGSPQSPVRLIYNLWLIWLGGFLSFTAWTYFVAYRLEFPILSVLLLLSIGIFAIGAGLISGFFSVNERKDTVTLSSKIHGLGAAIGFITLLFFSLINGIIACKQKDTFEAIISICAFVFAFFSFCCFVMGDKEQFQNSILTYEGLWERLTLFFMYIPFLYKSVTILLHSF